MLEVIETPPAFKPWFCADTGEFFEQGDEFDHEARRSFLSDRGRIDARRQVDFKLQRKAAAVMLKAAHPKGGTWRVPSCMWQANGANVEIVYTPANGRAVYSGVRVCGEIWTCAVCARKVTARRQVEVCEALEKHFANGGAVVMVTYTVRHGRENPLSDVLGWVSRSLPRFRANRAVRQVQRGRFLGAIRALEVTHGANGWHPHIHELWLLDDESAAEAVVRQSAALGVAWSSAVSTGGGDALAGVGLDVRQVQSVSQYVAKWGASEAMSYELTRGFAKRASRKGRTPFQLLADGATELFTEFATAFFGRRQLFWSPGLKKQFEIAEVSDEEAAHEAETPGDVVAVVPALRWKALRRRPQEYRSSLLYLVERTMSAPPDQVADPQRRLDEFLARILGPDT